MIVDMHIFFHPNFDNALHSSFIHRQSLTKFVLRFTSTISQLKFFFFKDAYKKKNNLNVHEIILALSLQTYKIIPPLVERGLYCNHLVRPFTLS